MSLKETNEKCRENWEKLPYSSQHVWNADHHGIPIGNCVKCGYPHEEWNKKLTIMLKTKWNKELDDRAKR